MIEKRMKACGLENNEMKSDGPYNYMHILNSNLKLVTPLMFSN